MRKLILLLAVFIGIVSCHDDLNQTPIDPDSFTEENVFVNAEEAKGALAKLYASLALTGQNQQLANPILQILMKDSLNLQECFST